MRFYLGLHQPSDAHKVWSAFLSVNRLQSRRKDLGCDDWIMDSGAFTQVALQSGFSMSPEQHAEVIERWRGRGLTRAVAQDYMCEPFVLAKTGGTVKQHQQWTIERYDALVDRVGSEIVMPVLQGYDPWEYVMHARMYGKRLKSNMWVGVGSVCKRNGSPSAIMEVLSAIKTERHDLRLHGFGLKTTALAEDRIWNSLYSADSMAWSFAARRQGRNANCVQEALRFAQQIETAPRQMGMVV